MMAIRWGKEIVVEKTCIIFAAFVTFSDTTAVAKVEGRSLQTQLALFSTFVGAELIADALLVYSLDKYYDVPILRLPRPSMRSRVFWSDSASAVLPVLGILLCFAYAQQSTNKWLGLD